jgi:hypothetical protein
MFNTFVPNFVPVTLKQNDGLQFGTRVKKATENKSKGSAVKRRLSQDGTIARSDAAIQGKNRSKLERSLKAELAEDDPLKRTLKGSKGQGARLKLLQDHFETVNPSRLAALRKKAGYPEERVIRNPRKPYSIPHRGKKHEQSPARQSSSPNVFSRSSSNRLKSQSPQPQTLDTYFQSSLSKYEKITDELYIGRRPAEDISLLVEDRRRNASDLRKLRGMQRDLEAKITALGRGLTPLEESE